MPEDDVGLVGALAAIVSVAAAAGGVDSHLPACDGGLIGGGGNGVRSANATILAAATAASIVFTL